MSRARWFLKDGALHCTHCRGRAGDDSHGKGHSFCIVEPSAGTGSPSPTDEPIRLAIGFSSRLSGRMTRYLDSSNDPYEKALKALDERYPHYASLYFANVVDGERLKDIAERLNISPSNARMRKARAMRFLESRMRFYEKGDVT